MNVHKKVTLKRVTAAVKRAMRGLDSPGFCTACGVSVGGCDPDARGDPCEHCGEPGVYGAEELVLMLA